MSITLGTNTMKPLSISAKRKLTCSVYHPSIGASEANSMRITRLRTDKTVARTSELVSLLILSLSMGCAVPLTK